MQLLAPAKINLALHVTGQRPDGYHLIDTLVTFANFGDRLQFQPGEGLNLTLSGEEAAGLETGSENLVLKAASLLRDHLGSPELGATIHLQKNLPTASGIGGGSADAAATLIGLCNLWELDLDLPALQKLALPLGADIPMCLAGQSARVSGIGEVIEPIDLPPLALVLVNPRIAVSTPLVFSTLDQKNNPPLPDSGTPWLDHLPDLRNDLQPAALQLAPIIGDCLKSLEGFDACRLARMSGSGATCFGLFETADEAQSAAAELRRRHPDWWVADTKTIG